MRRCAPSTARTDASMGKSATVALLPATAAPVGRAADGLPVGVQIVGPYLEDRTAIDFARKLADVTGGFQAPPLGT